MRVRGFVEVGLAMMVLMWGMKAKASDECLAPGFEASRTGDIETAIRLYRDALTRPACQAPDIEPLVRFSLAGALTSYAEVSPMAACDAAIELRVVVRIADDPDVAETAAKDLATAEGACAVAQGPGAPAAPPSMAPPPMVQPPMAQPTMAQSPMAPPRVAPKPTEISKVEPSVSDGDRQPSPSRRPGDGAGQVSEQSKADPGSATDRLRISVRLEAGVARLGGFESNVVDVVPGPALRAGLVLEWRLGDRLHARIEPGLAWQTVRFETFENAGAWRWWWVELPLIARMALAAGIDLSAGVSGALVLSADESESVFGDEIAPLGDSGRSWGVEASLGIGYGWTIEEQRMRVELRAAHGLVGVNHSDDVIGLMPQRLALGFEVAL